MKHTKCFLLTGEREVDASIGCSLVVAGVTITQHTLTIDCTGLYIQSQSSVTISGI